MRNYAFLHKDIVIKKKTKVETAKKGKSPNTTPSSNSIEADCVPRELNPKRKSGITILSVSNKDYK